MIKGIFYFSLLVNLAACVKEPVEADFVDYSQRVARSIEHPTESTRPSLTLVPAMPSGRALRLPETSLRIELLDYLALLDCELGVVVAKRNSSLGKLAEDSQRLLHELAFLRLAPECIRLLEAREQEELARQLEEARRTKQQQLPGMIWQATLGAAEFRDFWRQPHLLGDYPQQQNEAVIIALYQLHRYASAWLQGDYKADSASFEAALQTVSLGDAGALIKALTMQGAYIDRVNTTLRNRLRMPRPLCFEGRPGTQANIFNNVVHKYWIAQLQRWSVAVNRRHEVLLEPVRALETLLASAEPPAYEGWRKQRDTLLDKLVDKPRQHVEVIGTVLQQCGLAPQRPERTVFNNPQVKRPNCRSINHDIQSAHPSCQRT